MPKEQNKPTIVQKDGSYQYTFTYPTFYPPRNRIHLSVTETKHLIVATLLVIGVGLSLFGFPSFIYADHLALTLFVAMFTASFLMHEIAHKITAQRHGLRAEFRLVMMGALLTLLSVISPFFKFIAPGAVMVSGTADKGTIGRTSIAGPATNIILGTVFFTAALLFDWYSPILAPIAYLNAWIALFNLIPFAILDGQKIFNWDKKIWGLAFGISITLAIFPFLRLQR